MSEFHHGHITFAPILFAVGAENSEIHQIQKLNE